MRSPRAAAAADMRYESLGQPHLVALGVLAGVHRDRQAAAHVLGDLELAARQPAAHPARGLEAVRHVLDRLAVAADVIRDGVVSITIGYGCDISRP